MQAIYLIHKLSSRVATALRQRHSEHLSAALSREFSLADPRVRADIQRLIEARASAAASDAGANGDKEPSTPVAHAPLRGGFRAMPMPGLPTHMRYSTS